MPCLLFSIYSPRTKQPIIPKHTTTHTTYTYTHATTHTASNEMTGRLEIAPLNTVALIHVPRRQSPLEMESACRYPRAGESGEEGRAAAFLATAPPPQGSPCWRAGPPTWVDVGGYGWIVSCAVCGWVGVERLRVHQTPPPHKRKHPPTCNNTLKTPTNLLFLRLRRQAPGHQEEQAKV